MPTYKILMSAKYAHGIKKWPKDHKEEMQRHVEQLVSNPHAGSPLHYPFLHEKRVREKRAYYLIYDDLYAILLVDVSGKKDQQETILEIEQKLQEYRKIAEELNNEL